MTRKLLCIAFLAALIPVTTASAQDDEGGEMPQDENHGLPSGHPPMGATQALVSGSPFDSDAHARQAGLARSGRRMQPEAVTQTGQGLPPGTIGVLVKDGKGQPLANKTVKLKITKQSIASGDKESEKTAVTDPQGRAGFVDQNTETSFVYEIQLAEGGATYTSGPFQLQRDAGEVVSLFVFPSTKDINATFIVSRALYVIQPRSDAFQIQCLLRIHNTNATTWLPGGLAIPLPKSWQAFQPGETTGDLSLKQADNAVVVEGTFTPGQHDFSFSFQLPNKKKETAQLLLPTLPHLVDARVFLEASQSMSLEVDGFEPSEATRGNDGQHALLAARDFLLTQTPATGTLSATISGLPTPGWGRYAAFGIAGAIALVGLAFAVSRDERLTPRTIGEDRERAKQLILDELVLLERSFRSEEIGPKTYEQARRLLLDSLARLEAS